MKKNLNTICFLGDSITEGWGASNLEKCFVSLFKQAHNDVNVCNYGRWGTRIARQKKASESACMDEDFNMRVEQISEAADTVVVFGGTNDFGHGDAEFGSIDDATVWTFCGAVNCLFKKLKEKFSTAKIIVVTPLHRSDEMVRNMHGKLLVDYVSAIREIAGSYSLDILDLFNCSGIKGQTADGEENYLIDGLHPNDAGHYKIFESLEAFIKA